jgi:predicted N-formylglutamate amidohydrolase
MDSIVMIEGTDRPGPWLVTCDHASNHVPSWINGGDLGLGPQDMARHIAWDVGAWGLAQALGRLLDSPVIGAGFSRLVIDPNRGEADPTLVMRLYDGTIIPANRHITKDEIAQRLDRLYRPYHAAYGDMVTRARAVLAIHSFTPCLRGRARRPWHLGVLYSHLDPRLSQCLIKCLSGEADLCIGDNQPYNGHLPGDALDQHCLRFGRHNALVELRNDLIADSAGQQAWAARLAPMLTKTIALTAGD